MKDFKKVVLEFHNQITSQDNKPHRYRSWEHCYQAFSNPYRNDDELALHLMVYLASWGMYRGSSFMLEFDYKIHLPIVSLLKKNHEALFGLSLSDFKSRIPQIIELHENIQEIYSKLGTYSKAGKTYKVIASDTLTTKIMLGTLGCVPAYDRFLREGLKAFQISGQFNISSLENLYQYLHEKNLKLIETRIAISGYPDMKLIDMYFFQKGLSASKINIRNAA